MTAAVDRCPRTDLPKDGCAHCRPGGDRPAPERLESDVTVYFTAQYDGNCADCGERWWAGSQIGRLREGGYLGECCLP